MDRYRERAEEESGRRAGGGGGGMVLLTPQVAIPAGMPAHPPLSPSVASPLAAAVLSPSRARWDWPLRRLAKRSSIRALSGVGVSGWG